MNGRVLEALGISKRYPGAGPVLQEFSLSLDQGESIALLGESGAGKSTLARCLAGWEQPDSGLVIRNGCVQLIPQDPASSLQPRFTLLEILNEPLRICRQPCRNHARQMLDRLGIPQSQARNRPLELSGGQRARLAIGRALMIQPQVLILDESLSALDLPLQVDILQWLLRLRREESLALIFITHSSLWLQRIADRVITMAATHV